jgi:hypothetical protein
MLLVLPDNMIVECPTTDCNRLGDNKKRKQTKQNVVAEIKRNRRKKASK